MSNVQSEVLQDFGRVVETNTFEDGRVVETLVKEDGTKTTISVDSQSDYALGNERNPFNVTSYPSTRLKRLKAIHQMSKSDIQKQLAKELEAGGWRLMSLNTTHFHWEHREYKGLTLYTPKSASGNHTVKNALGDAKKLIRNHLESLKTKDSTTNQTPSKPSGAKASKTSKTASKKAKDVARTKKMGKFTNISRQETKKKDKKAKKAKKDKKDKKSD